MHLSYASDELLRSVKEADAPCIDDTIILEEVPHVKMHRSHAVDGLLRLVKEADAPCIDDTIVLEKVPHVTMHRSHAVDGLLRLVKEAEAAGIVLEEDPVGALMAPEASAGKAWQDSAREIMARLQVGQQGILAAVGAGCCKGSGPLWAIRCGILPQSRLALLGVLCFILFYFYQRTCWHALHVLTLQYLLHTPKFAIQLEI